MEQSNSHEKLGFDIVMSTELVTGKRSPGSAVDFRGINAVVF
jgi:hypothetical protein